jgi:hypothetical protein
MRWNVADPIPSPDSDSALRAKEALAEQWQWARFPFGPKHRFRLVPPRGKTGFSLIARGAKSVDQDTLISNDSFSDWTQSR